MLTNPGHEWLTYEVLFNHPIFRRTDGRHRMGAYSLPLTAVRVVLAERLLDENAPDQAQRDATLEHLRRAFFPDATSISKVRTFADRLSGADGKRHATSTSKPANGRAVLPFNPKDNEPETHAMGAADRSTDRIKSRDQVAFDATREACKAPGWRSEVAGSAPERAS